MTLSPRSYITIARHAHVLCFSLIISLTSLAPADEPANTDLLRFLPNHGNSVYHATGLLREWPAEGPKQLWRAEIGFGKSAIVEANGRAFTATEIDDKQCAISLDPLTGVIQWKVVLVPKNNRHYVSGPVTSPVVDGDRVYMIGYDKDKDVWDMRCPIVCVKTDGTELWRVDENVWATEGSTPLVVGDTLYVAADSLKHEILVALDKMTGELRWSAAVDELPRNRELAAASSLTYQVVDGIPQVIVATYGTREVLGMHADTGEIMWRLPYPAPLVLGMVSTPVAMGSRVLICANEKKGLSFSALLDMQAVDGKITPREIYRSTDLQTNHYNTAAIHNGAVFGFGGGTQAGFLHCTNFDDGRLLWKQEGREWTKDQNLSVADGLIFALNANNELVLAEASREGYRELSRFRLDVEVGRPQQPTIANGRLYIRGVNEAACYQIAE